MFTLENGLARRTELRIQPRGPVLITQVRAHQHVTPILLNEVERVTQPKEITLPPNNDGSLEPLRFAGRANHFNDRRRTSRLREVTLDTPTKTPRHHRQDASLPATTGPNVRRCRTTAVPGAG